MTEDPDHPPTTPTDGPGGPGAGTSDVEVGPAETYRAEKPRARPHRRAPRKPGEPKPKPRFSWRFWLAAFAGGAFLAGLSALFSGYAFVQEHYLQDVPETPPKEQLDVINRAPAIRFWVR